MLLSQVLKNVECTQNEIPIIEVENITANINHINRNTLFVFFIGIKFDTRKIINYIISKRPAIIVSDKFLNVSTEIPIVYVKNARKAYSYALWNFNRIDEKKIKFYAVTGTNGKTTTATMLFNIFSISGIKCGFIGTGKILIEKTVVSDAYYSMTTPDPEILYPIIKKMQNCGCEKIVMEVSSHALSLFKVAPIRFECSLFTNLSEEHIDFHKTIDEYYNSKISLFIQSKCGIFNLDDEYGKKALSYSSQYIDTYSIAIYNEADAKAKDIISNGFKGCSYIYSEPNSIFKIKLHSSGEYNILNSLLAIKCASLSGIGEEVITKSFECQKGIDGRFEIISENPMVIIDYAHTFAAFQTILKFVKETKKTEQKVISVFGCGGERDVLKRPKMAFISETFSDFSIVTSDNSRGENLRKIISEICQGFTDTKKYCIIENRADAITTAIECARDIDIVLVIGKGHERYNIDESGYHSFDEREIILKALKERKTK